MLIGCDKVNTSALEKCVRANGDVVAFALDLVPIWAKHIQGIESNQRYYVAIKLRSITALEYKLKQKAIEALLHDIHLVGVLNQFVSIEDIVQYSNKSLLADALEEEWSNG